MMMYKKFFVVMHLVFLPIVIIGKTSNVVLLRSQSPRTRGLVALMGSGEGFISSGRAVTAFGRFATSASNDFNNEEEVKLSSSPFGQQPTTSSSFSLSSDDVAAGKTRSFLQDDKLTSSAEKGLEGNSVHDRGKDAVGWSAMMMESAKTVSLLGMWYALNILYNIDNKKSLNLYPLPVTVSAIQMLVGIPLFTLPWLLGIRARPHIYTADGYRQMAIQGFLHAAVHISAVIALGAGAISFVHIVKAAEPVTTAALSRIVLEQKLSFLTYLSLLPIILGVSLASLTELSFTWLALTGAMISNMSSSLRGIYSKKAMMDKDKLGRHLNPSNMYAILTLFGSLFLVPTMLYDLRKIIPTWNAAIGKGATPALIARHVIGSGIWYYLYNEVAFVALSRLDTVSHAVANTFKRVALILASVVVFGTVFTTLGAVGSGVAVCGTLLYSLSKTAGKKRIGERKI